MNTRTNQWVNAVWYELLLSLLVVCLLLCRPNRSRLPTRSFFSAPFTSFLSFAPFYSHSKVNQWMHWIGGYCCFWCCHSDLFSCYYDYYYSCCCCLLLLLFIMIIYDLCAKCHLNVELSFFFNHSFYEIVIYYEYFSLFLFALLVKGLIVVWDCISFTWIDLIDLIKDTHGGRSRLWNRMSYEIWNFEKLAQLLSSFAFERFESSSTAPYLNHLQDF